ncbi:uncharacterized protein LOC115726822 isoform X1 [Rhodamnia argentea]|uniref:Uncharacterized protein LOC115726822 isoform X1 n=1 Tax=Rhodamnia argentea TaxID=178133 RepID=A0A8B8MS23_9MYRT|nr:uncharacterized protein LOC115726822 isoform X1 [Rhodamnia argentea]XP_048138395.1 uncharacterized protein LOC115726822 isoform X1 [Rhodamnia argentea]
MDDCARLSTYEESRRPSSPPTSRNCSATLSSEDPSPIRHVLCVTRDEDIKRFEETEDCFILGFDPFQRFCRLYVSTTEAGGTDAEDLVVVAEKGQVACRDFPHARHLCQKFPFATTPHERHCELCYCYVCDSAAPCKNWSSKGHCDATEHDKKWKSMRGKRSKETETTMNGN